MSEVQRPKRPKLCDVYISDTVTTTERVYRSSEADAYMDHLEAEIARLREANEDFRKLPAGIIEYAKRVQDQRDRAVELLREMIEEVLGEFLSPISNMGRSAVYDGRMTDIDIKDLRARCYAFLSEIEEDKHE